MIKEYLGNNTYKYTLTSGSEVTLSKEELEELIDEQDSQLVEDLESTIVKLESDIESLKEDIIDNKTEISSLNKEIKRLHSKVQFNYDELAQLVRAAPSKLLIH